MKRLVGIVSAAVLVLVVQTPARGFDLRAGANANFGTTNDFGVGPRVEFVPGDYLPGLRFAADYHFFFDSRTYKDVDGLTVDSHSWDAGFHVLYDLTTLAIAEGATLYAGAGMLYAKRHYKYRQPSAEGITADELLHHSENLNKLKEKYQSASGASIALTVGSTFDTGWTVIPFVEARYTFGVVDELMLAVGILFSTDSEGW